MDMPFFMVYPKNQFFEKIYYFIFKQCDKTCGEGKRQRLVRCQDHLGQTLPDTDCPIADRPHNVMACSRQQCPKSLVPRYHWRKSAWSPVCKIYHLYESSLYESQILEIEVYCTNLTQMNCNCSALSPATRANPYVKWFV